jgi:hypothetical protein
MNKNVFKVILYTILTFTLHSFNSASAVKASPFLTDDQENKTREHYLQHTGELREDVESDLNSLKISDPKRKHVVQMLILSEFYYCKAETLSELFSPKETENKITYGKRLASKQHTDQIQLMLLAYPTINSLTLVKPPELKTMYGQEQMMTKLQNRFKMPLELVAQAYAQCKRSKNTETLKGFFNAAFSEGCIAKRTTKLSTWMEKHLTLD